MNFRSAPYVTPCLCELTVSFKGTLFFSYYGGEKIAETVNSIGFDAMTVGNVRMHLWGRDIWAYSLTCSMNSTEETTTSLNMLVYIFKRSAWLLTRLWIMY